MGALKLGCTMESRTAVAEGICGQNGVTNTLMPCPAGNRCSGGRCVTPAPTRTPTPLPPPCNDSDGGQNVLVAGTATSLVTGIGSYLADTCAGNNGSPCSGSACPAVMEAYCGQTGPATRLTLCPAGTLCGAGRCAPIPQPTPTATPTPSVPSCMDSDAGKNIYVSGATYSRTGSNQLDTCVNTNGSACTANCPAVREAYCDLLSSKTIVIPCPAGNICNAGKCEPAV